MVYLIHFSEKLHHAQHYIGYVKSNLSERLHQHKTGQGAKLLKAVNECGIEWEVVKVWRKGDRHFERKLKNYKKARRFCPFCNEYHYL
jgi:predicted GIY-YIG superfamily endonuclease